MVRSKADAESDHDQGGSLLDLSDEALANVPDSDWDGAENNIGKEFTVAQLRTWLTDQQVSLPAGVVKKAEYVSLAVKKLSEKRMAQLAKRKSSSPRKSPLKSPKKIAASSTQKRRATPRKKKVVGTPGREAAVQEDKPTSTGKRHRSAGETAVENVVGEDERSQSPIKKTKLDDVGASAAKKRLANPSPMVATKFITRLNQLSKASSVANAEPTHELSRMASPSTSVALERELRFDSPKITVSDQNLFQSSSAKKRNTESKISERRTSLLLQDESADRATFRSSIRTEMGPERTSSAKIYRDENVKSGHLVPGHSPSLQVTPSLTAVQPRKLFSVGGTSSPRRVVRQTVVVSGPPSKTTTLRNFLLALFVVIVSMVGLSYLPVLPPVRYCPSSSSDAPIPNCVPCPSRAICDKFGNANCWNGLVLKNNECIDNPMVVVLAEDMHDEVQALCARHHGAVVCGEQGTKFVSMETVDRHLFQLHGKEPLYKDAHRKTMEMIRSNTTGMSVRYCADPPSVWTDEVWRPMKCAIRHWAAQHAPVFGAFLSVVAAVAIMVFRRRRYSNRIERAVLVFKEALSVLKASDGPVALDHLSATAFEHCQLPMDQAVWNLALEQLARDSRINNAITFRHGVQKKGMVFSQIPLRTSDNRPVHLYPSVERK